MVYTPGILKYVSCCAVGVFCAHQVSNLGSTVVYGSDNRRCRQTCTCAWSECGSLKGILWLYSKDATNAVGYVSNYVVKLSFGYKVLGVLFSFEVEVVGILVEAILGSHIQGTPGVGKCI